MMSLSLHHLYLSALGRISEVKSLYSAVEDIVRPWTLDQLENQKESKSQCE